MSLWTIGYNLAEEFRRRNSEFRRRELNVERRLKIEGGDGRACLMIRIRGYSTAVNSPGESGESKLAGGLSESALHFHESGVKRSVGTSQ